MPGVAILCWEENRPWVSALRQRGLSVPWVEEPKTENYREMLEFEPELLLVDMTRLPEKARDLLNDLADSGDLKNLPVLLASDAAGADRGLRSKIPVITVTKPSRIVSAVRAALGE